MYKARLREKFDEALRAVLPIVAIVLVLCFTVAPTSTGVMMAFLVGGVLLTVGMMFFSLGAELSMTVMGERMGAQMTRSKKLRFILPLGFLLGFLVTISEPDLQVLAEQVQAVPPRVLILSVAVGVGLFVCIAFLRMLVSVSLQQLLIVFYLIVFILAFFVPQSFLALAFDAGGVTTGPMTVPFIIALGVGVCSIRSDSNAASDSFGLVALGSIGPIIAVMLLVLIYRPEAGEYVVDIIPQVDQSIALGRLFVEAVPEYLTDMALSLGPIALFFAVFELLWLKLDRRTLARIGVGILYTYVGLVLFLTGVGVGFMPAGSLLGGTLAGSSFRGILIPVGMLIGYFIVKAEPAVYVLMKQVEELTDGAISGKAMQRSLSLGVALSVGLAMVRVLSGVSILWLIIPGYALALIMSFFVPRIFTAIAFDSGGVASGPMTATFLLPLAVGACVAVGGNVLSDAFGMVAMVAMTPLITIQGLGLIYRLREKRRAKDAPVPILPQLGDGDIIEL
ncbi:MAG: DUF1538 domain-containing protein [Firmicutes bacterium]|nr:DUF1538 domain-containing protein [Bacillota bacterium]